MEPAIIGSIITSVTTIAVGIGVGWFGNSKLEKLKSELGINENNTIEFMKRKREIYEELCSGLQFIISGRIPPEESVNYRARAFESYDKLSLWGSDEVCRAADNLFKVLAEKGPENQIKENYIQLLQAMREDLTSESSYTRDYLFIS